MNSKNVLSFRKKVSTIFAFPSFFFKLGWCDCVHTSNSSSKGNFSIAFRFHNLYSSSTSLRVRADSSYSLWRFAPAPHPLFGASRRLLTFSSALRADSSYFLWRFAPICRNLFGASRRLLTFPNPPQPQKPDFWLFKTLCILGRGTWDRYLQVPKMYLVISHTWSTQSCWLDQSDPERQNWRF